MFVQVQRADGSHAEDVNPAEARRAVKDGLARWLCKNPPVIELDSLWDHLPRTYGRARERHFMKTTTDFFNLFQEEKPLWVKTLVPGQVSLTIQLGNGQDTSLLVPHSGDPVSLTDQAPFHALKMSMDIRKLALPRQVKGAGGAPRLKPPAIRIMTQDEVREHYRKKAIKLDYRTPEGEPDVERAMEPVITEPASPRLLDRVDNAGADEDQPMNKPPKPQPLYVAEAIEPRVLQLCLEANPTDNDNPLPADAMLLELDNMGPLNEDSLQHILANGHHASVKKWAQAELADRFNGSDE